MKNLVCFLEEASAKVMLEEILPKILPQAVRFRCYAFEGKSDLDKRLEMRLRLWQEPDSCFLILRDKDSGDCVVIKNNLIEKVKNTGKLENTCVRIACHAIESFYLGDLAAVESGLKLPNIAKQQNKSKFRNPDILANANDELKNLTKKKYQKIAGSRSIAPYLKLDGTNKSTSFNALITGVQKMFAID